MAKPIDASKSKEVAYLIAIKTGDVKKIGTVLLTITGTKGVIEKVHLKENKAKKTPFEKGKLDEFEINGVDVGTISKIHIGHDGKGGWFLETVSIKKGSQTINFAANRWLDEKEGDKKKSIELTPDVGKPPAADPKKPGAPPAPQANAKAPAGQRSVSQGPPAAQPSQNKNPAPSQAKQPEKKPDAKTPAASQTQNKAPAATKPAPQPAQPAKPAAAQNNNKTSQASTTTQNKSQPAAPAAAGKGASSSQPPPNNKAAAAGKPTTQPAAATKPGQAPPQNSKAGPAANSKSQPSNNAKAQDTTAKGKSTSLPPTQNRPQAQPGKPQQQQQNAKTTYKITIKTADELGAGTDAKVSIKLTGTKGSTGELALDEKAFTGKKAKDLFERGHTDEFAIEAADVGQVTQVVISQAGKKLGSSWKIDTVKVDTKTDSETWKVNRWIDKDSKEPKLELKTAKKISDAKPAAAGTTQGQAKKPEPATSQAKKPEPVPKKPEPAAKPPATAASKSQPAAKPSKSSSSPPPSNKNKTAPSSSTPPPPSKLAKSSSSPPPKTAAKSSTSSMQAASKATASQDESTERFQPLEHLVETCY